MVTIPAQFNGPDHSGNGGYVAGLIAEQVGAEQVGAEQVGAEQVGAGPVTSTLRIPPPLDVALSWERDTHHEGDLVRLLTAGGAVIGSASPGEFVREAPIAPTLADAERGLAAYPGFSNHPFDRCFTCGTARDDGDGLRLFTGPIDGNRTAAAWTPHEAFGDVDGLLDIATTWAALDCPGGWAADFNEQIMVLGRMTAEILRRPLAGEQHIAVGELRSREGRKFMTDTALYTVDGELIGRAEQIWIQIEGDAFR